MITTICIVFLIGPGDYRFTKKIKGQILKTTANYLLVDFTGNKIDTKYNNVVQWVSQNDCMISE